MKLSAITRRSTGQTRGSARKVEQRQEQREQTEYTVPDDIDVPSDPALRHTFLALCSAAIVKVQDGKTPWCKTYEIARALGQEQSNWDDLEQLRADGFVVKSTKFFPSSFAPVAFLPQRENRTKNHSAKDARTSDILRKLSASYPVEADKTGTE